jgi:1,4-dihydroxy-2-naphthoate octaprenyltransferase
MNYWTRKEWLLLAIGIVCLAIGIAMSTKRV